MLCDEGDAELENEAYFSFLFTLKRTFKEYLKRTTNSFHFTSLLRLINIKVGNNLKKMH